ncbi:MAG: hypothetical protein U5N85_07420 [Arcicella sp.]|nr:hypothetical protein [Arcicella sp.]
MKNRNKIIFLACAIFFIGIGIFFSAKNAKRNGDVFAKTNIEGLISYVNIGSRGASVFKIKNMPDKYNFLSIQDSTNDYHAFHEIAEIGDSVLKKINGKELILIKKNGGKEYKYFW